ncbi:MAG TPA: hypothetical protein VJQ47_18310 [Steroidobacteraceae bacterium]|nr:hypothetical protein [Steroidobacteraceae bacterium]
MKAATATLATKRRRSPAPAGGETQSRRDRVIDAALEVLAQYGARGFTHREVDRYLGQPLGSTSNYFRRRIDLLSMTGARMMELDLLDVTRILGTVSPNPTVTVERVADLLLQLYELWMRPENHSRALARMEITIERLRNAELSAATQGLIAQAEERFQVIFERLGSKSPSRSATHFLRLLVSMNVFILEDRATPDRLLLRTLLRDWLMVSLKAMSDRSGAARNSRK